MSTWTKTLIASCIFFGSLTATSVASADLASPERSACAGKSRGDACGDKGTCQPPMAQCDTDASADWPSYYCKTLSCSASVARAQQATSAKAEGKGTNDGSEVAEPEPTSDVPAASESSGGCTMATSKTVAPWGIAIPLALGITFLGRKRRTRKP